MSLNYRTFAFEMREQRNLFFFSFFCKLSALKISIQNNFVLFLRWHLAIKLSESKLLLVTSAILKIICPYFTYFRSWHPYILDSYLNVSVITCRWIHYYLLIITNNADFNRPNLTTVSLTHSYHIHNFKSRNSRSLVIVK